MQEFYLLDNEYEYHVLQMNSDTGILVKPGIIFASRGDALDYVKHLNSQNNMEDTDE